MQIRLNIGYTCGNFKMPDQVFIHCYCGKFAISITDQQLSMIFRLIYIIFNRNISNPLVNRNARCEINPIETPFKNAETDKQGWLSYMWSYVSFFSSFSNPEEHKINFELIYILNFAFYCDEIEFCLKVMLLKFILKTWMFLFLIIL